MCASQSGGLRNTQSTFHRSSHARRRGHEAGATCRAVAASFDIAPSTAGKWNRAFARSGPWARQGSAATSGPPSSPPGVVS